MQSQLGRLVSWVLLIGGIAAIIYPALIDEKTSLTQIFLSLLRPELTLAFAMRWLLVIFVACFGYIMAVHAVYRNIPISVIRTVFTFAFDPNDATKATVSREQLLRANRPDVTAYYSRVWPESQNGTVPRVGINAKITGVMDDWNDDLDMYGNDQRGYDIIHNFGRALPYRWYMPLIPHGWMNSDFRTLPSFIKSFLAIRRQSAVYHNEYAVGSASFTFVADQYPQHYVRVEFTFQDGIPQGFKARRIRKNGVLQVGIDRNLATNTAVVHVDRIHNETLRISW